MTKMRAEVPTPTPEAARRRFLAALGAALGPILGGGLVAALVGPLATRRQEPPEEPRRALSLREADYYRPHDLAG